MPNQTSIFDISIHETSNIEKFSIRLSKTYWSLRKDCRNCSSNERSCRRLEMFEFLTQSVNLSVNERERIGALTIEEVEFLLLV